MSVEIIIGEYRLRIDTETEAMWLENSGGEGMELFSGELERLLGEHFEGQF